MASHYRILDLDDLVLELVSGKRLVNLMYRDDIKILGLSKSLGFQSGIINVNPSQPMMYKLKNKVLLKHNIIILTKSSFKLNDNIFRFMYNRSTHSLDFCINDDKFDIIFYDFQKVRDSVNDIEFYYLYKYQSYYAIVYKVKTVLNRLVGYVTIVINSDNKIIDVVLNYLGENFIVNNNCMTNDVLITKLKMMHKDFIDLVNKVD
jgi:hypothetical protein